MTWSRPRSAACDVPAPATRARRVPPRQGIRFARGGFYVPAVARVLQNDDAIMTTRRPRADAAASLPSGSKMSLRHPYG